MTHSKAKEIADDYARIEADQNATPQGADAEVVLQAVIARHLAPGLTIADIRRAVLDHVFTRPV